MRQPQPLLCIRKVRVLLGVPESHCGEKASCGWACPGRGLLSTTMEAPRTIKVVGGRRVALCGTRPARIILDRFQALPACRS